MRCSEGWGGPRSFLHPQHWGAREPTAAATGPEADEVTEHKASERGPAAACGSEVLHAAKQRLTASNLSGVSRHCL